MSRRALFACGLVAVVFLAASTFAADKAVRGTVKGVDKDTFLITTNTGTNIVFTVDSRTLVIGKDGKARSTKPQTVELFDLLKTGDAVDIGFRDFGGTTHASQIKWINLDTSNPSTASAPSPPPASS